MASSQDIPQGQDGIRECAVSLPSTLGTAAAASTQLVRPGAGTPGAEHKSTGICTQGNENYNMYGYLPAAVAPIHFAVHSSRVREIASTKGARPTSSATWRRRGIGPRLEMLLNTQGLSCFGELAAISGDPNARALEPRVDHSTNAVLQERRPEASSTLRRTHSAAVPTVFHRCVLYLCCTFPLLSR
jgi:hypothetical protein